MQALAKQSSKRGEVFRPTPLLETQKQVSEHGFATQEQENTQNSTLDNYAGGIEHSFSQIPLFRPNSPFIQPKLTINTPNDIYEQEADSMAERVMNLPEKSPLPNPTISQLNNVIQRKCAKCGEEDDEKEGTLMRKAEYGGSFQTPPTLSTQLNASKGIGSPLPERTRGLMQNAFNADFSGVRIHTGNSANDMSRGIQARAFTHGQDIYFNRGEYSPESGEGKRLLAHELTHTLQQSGSNIQRKEATEQQEESPSSQPSTFIVEDNSAPAAGQMTKSEFLATLNAAVCATVDQELRGTPYSSDNCPYISAAFSRHQNSSATQIEQLLARYEPNTTSAQTAEGLIGLVLRRVSVAVNRWKQRGNLADVPEDITGLLAEGGSDAPPKSTGEAGQSVAPSLQFKANAGGANATQSPQAVMQNLGKGSPLDGSTRGRMESAFGTNFGNVEIHTDSNASNLASGMNARAFAVGNHIAFGSGEHQPGTLMGDALMAHELAHTVQQGNGVSNGGGTSAYSSLEEDADFSAIGAVTSLWGGLKNVGKNVGPRMRSGLRLQRCKSKKVVIKNPFEEPIAVKNAAGASSVLDTYKSLPESDRLLAVMTANRTALINVLRTLSSEDKVVKYKEQIREITGWIEEIETRSASKMTDEQIAAEQSKFMLKEAQDSAKAAKLAAGTPPAAPTPAEIEKELKKKVESTSIAPPPPVNAWDALAPLPAADPNSQPNWTKRGNTAIIKVIAYISAKYPELGITASKFRLAFHDVAERGANVLAFGESDRVGGTRGAVGFSFVSAAELNPAYVVDIVVHEVYGHPEYGTYGNEYQLALYDKAVAKIPGYIKPASGTSARTTEVDSFAYQETEIYSVLRSMPYRTTPTTADASKVPNFDTQTIVDWRVGLMKKNWAPSLIVPIVRGLRARLLADPRITPAALVVFDKAIDNNFTTYTANLIKK